MFRALLVPRPRNGLPYVIENAVEWQSWMRGGGSIYERVPRARPQLGSCAWNQPASRYP